MTQPVIHIVNGGLAGGIIREALDLRSPKDLLISHDLYSCGPLLPIESITEWHAARKRWWVRLYASQGEEPPSDTDMPFDLVDNRDALRTSEAVIVWLGTGLGDQLLLAFLMQLLGILGVEPSRLRAIQYDRIGPGRLGKVISIGELDTGHIRQHPKPEALQRNAIAELGEAWQALSAAKPDSLTSFLACSNKSLPFLASSLRSLLVRYPDHRSGLGIWEHAALQYTIQHAPQASRIVGAMMTYDLEQPDWPGDSFLYSHLQRLDAPGIAHPLVSLSEPNKPMRETTVTITDTGRAVLNGEANAVELNGIDDWVAGVHLNSNAGRVWFHRDGELVAAG